MAKLTDGRILEVAQNSHLGKYNQAPSVSAKLFAFGGGYLFKHPGGFNKSAADYLVGTEDTFNGTDF